jgi:MFS family permease
MSARYGPRLFMAVGPLVGGVSVLALARLPADVNYAADLLGPMLGFAAGLTLTVAPLTTTVLSDAGPGDAGVASGVNNAVARIAGLVAIAGIGVVAAGGTDTLTEHGFHVAMLTAGAIICLGGLVGAVGIRNPA